jgi:hypothetical protein
LLPILGKRIGVTGHDAEVRDAVVALLGKLGRLPELRPVVSPQAKSFISSSELPLSLLYPA